MANRVKGMEYIEFELDSDTLAEVEALAEESRLTPFEMSLTLLKETISFACAAPKSRGASTLVRSRAR